MLIACMHARFIDGPQKPIENRSTDFFTKFYKVEIATISGDNVLLDQSHPFEDNRFQTTLFRNCLGDYLVIGTRKLLLP